MLHLFLLNQWKERLTVFFSRNERETSNWRNINNKLDAKEGSGLRSKRLEDEDGDDDDWRWSKKLEEGEWETRTSSKTASRKEKDLQTIFKRSPLQYIYLFLFLLNPFFVPFVGINSFLLRKEYILSTLFVMCLKFVWTLTLVYYNFQERERERDV